MRIALALFGIGVTACADTGSRIVLVSTEVGLGQGVDLASLAIIDEGADRGVADFCVRQSQVISLWGEHAEVFCAKGRDFERLADIPVEADGCPGALSNTWSQGALLSGAGEHTTAESHVAGDGYLVRTRDDTLFRMRVVSDAYDEQGTAVVTLDVEPVP